MTQRCPDCYYDEQSGRIVELCDRHKRVAAGAAFEQTTQHMLEVLPGLYWGMYVRYVKEGFTPDQALKIVCAFAAGSLHK